MEINKEEALKAKEIAEKRFAEKDFIDAKNYAVKAKSLYPDLEGISQMVATFEVYAATEYRSCGEIDHYSILGLKPTSSKDAVKKQYKKMAVLLHPDKNKCVGADGAFKLVSEAWTLLSDTTKRNFYDIQRNKHLTTAVNQPNYSTVHTGGLSTSHSRLDTFWTVCTSCKVQYEYLRKYVNKRLSCKNCRGVFIAVESGAAPANGSFPYTPWPYVSGNGHSNHGVTYVPNSGTLFPTNGAPGYHSGHGYEYISNVSFQWSSYSGTSAGVVSPHGSSSAIPSEIVYPANGKVNKKPGPKPKLRVNGKRPMKSAVVNVDLNVSASYNERPKIKHNGSEKKRKLVVGASFRVGNNEKVPQSASVAILANGNGSIGHDQKLPCPEDVPIRRCSTAPAFDARKMLIEKARTEISKKLEERKLTSEVAVGAVKNKKKQVEVVVAAASLRKTKRHVEVEVAAASLKKTKRRVEVCQSGGASGYQLDTMKSEPHSPRDPEPQNMPVPDSDFHNFDEDRSEECFKPKQIWALYDEDGMPRLYCLIREVVSVKPFKLLITYLSSKTDSEFGTVNWLDSGFTKSCGNFRARHLDVVEHVNIFSHILSGTKAARGGIVQIYPKSGDIWALYRNWSKDWDSSTPDEVRHQYQMVEVLDDYSEEIGVCVSPLVKLAGFKSVYQTDTDRSAILWIPRREMLRFSHQVPAWLLNAEETNLPGKCWDLDPAATPEGLLNAATPDEQLHAATPEELPHAARDELLHAATGDKLLHAATGDKLLHAAGESEA
ncbi:uncharacterized protein LOC126798131 [Argentina anserina]|uniref:uncharacterized protein LOC126798131 n=1 Tax=Argentina anserina TaxID=57926 RepID=UPI0021762867|nr:uncharacterized protein LOC126798131 [Potentilla anserina]XP_050380933.1 uncharacterized protein LOC126798131 [Potentilla anserina]